MNIIEYNGTILESKYVSWICNFCSSDFDMGHDDLSILLEQTYNIEYILKRKLLETSCNPMEYFSRCVSGIYDRIIPIKSKDRNIFNIISKALFSDHIDQSYFILCIKDLVKMCELHSVAYLSIQKINTNDSFDWDKMLYIIFNEFNNTNIEISICDNFIPLDPFKSYPYTEDVYEETKIDKSYKQPNRYNTEDSKIIEYRINHDRTYINSIDAELSRKKLEIYPDINPYPNKCEYFNNDIIESHYQESLIPRSDPLHKFIHGIDGVSSYAYPVEDIINKSIFYINNQEQPVYKDPIIPNIDSPAGKGINRSDDNRPYVDPVYTLDRIDYNSHESNIINSNDNNNSLMPVDKFDKAYVTDNFITNISNNKKYSDEYYNDDPLNRKEEINNINSSMEQIKPEFDSSISFKDLETDLYLDDVFTNDVDVPYITNPNNALYTKDQNICVYHHE